MKQIELGRSYIGQAEKPGNDFDLDTKLGRILKEAGQKDGEAWCCYFAEAIFVETLRALFSASTVQTFLNFKQAGYEISETPKVGWLVIWQHYKDGKALWSGHAGICTVANPDNSFFAVEGNTDKKGSRTGGSVQENSHTLTRVQTGLNVLGFVNILDIKPN